MGWGGFTEAEVEWQYNPRETVPDFADHFARFVAASDDVRAKLDHQSDVRFGPGPKETFDVFPAGSPDAPVHVFFHGGYWRSQDKKDYAFIVRDLVADGYTVVCANYDLCPDVKVEDITAQAIRCIKYVYEHIGDFNGDRDRLSISGHSAGGQIVARLAAHDWENEIGDATPFNAVVPVSGVFDLEPLRFTSMNIDIRLTEDSAADNSPMLDAVPVGARMMLVVGAVETPEFVRQSQAYAAYCAKAGLIVPVHQAWGANHFTVLEELYLRDGALYGNLKRIIG
ncbi:alpha/beta hydrolase [Thalassospira sp. MCCC 1A01428]|uniref:alpha/beta hydrolase n=1 Tax=unclassified Thalassospira TaxID=2648997 RepID=UPI000A1F0D47|nr:alpha/beta hydrolase [Thalassospira sp. MCCC 1A01428]OSQ42208.1 esterase [Thalassospira sp. MCCC 1A01428]